MKMRKILKFATFGFSFFAFSNLAFADSYPNMTGQVLAEMRYDHVLDSNKNNLESNAGYLNIEPDFSFNFRPNWSVKTGLRILPVRQRRYDHPERQRFILGNEEGTNRGFNQDDTGIIVEEIKLHFENEDMRAQLGKFNPTFGTLYRRSKKIGLFVTDITEDYELREQIGGSVSAILEDAEVTVNAFMADTTGLSNSALRQREERSSKDGTSANTDYPNSYSVTVEGQNLFGLNNLFYNVGYRNMAVESNVINTKRESGYTVNLEYLYRYSRNASLIPVLEIASFKNFTGLDGRDADYITMALVSKYSSWTASIAQVYRNLDNNSTLASRQKNRDELLQFSVGYQFTDNFSLDVSRAEIKEDGSKSSNVGFIASYFYEF